MSWHAAWLVFVKELVDALRDRRTLAMVVLSSVAVGPLVLVVLSTMVADIEDRAESREIAVQGLDAAPTLENFLLRQTMKVVRVGGPAQQAVRSGEAVALLVVPADFEQLLARGEAPRLEIVLDSVHTRSQAAAGSINRLLRGFNQEQLRLRLAYRGIAAAQLEAVEVEQTDLAPPTLRAARLTGMVPFLLMMAMVYGALGAALDTTVGERERGSLEPLLMTPAPYGALVLGKWAAASALGMLVAVLGCLSFLPAQWFMRSETLAALFRFGPAEALAFIALLLPLAGALSAALMALAIRCRTLKEAQASSAIVLLAVSLLPFFTLLYPSTAARWELAVPALGQVRLMQRVLEGSPITSWELALPALASLALAALCGAWVARSLSQAAVR